ncbi:MAG: hypothetical protein AAFX76_02150 [Planctomycetota bacterium]
MNTDASPNSASLAATTALVPLDTDGLIAADLPCRGCGYLLRKQPSDARCPECDRPVQETINASNLRLCPPNWLGQVQSGAMCLAVAIPAAFIFGFGVILWILGALTLILESPREPRSLHRLGKMAAITGAVGVLSFLVMMSGLGSGGDELPFVIALCVGVLAVGLHVGAVVRVGAVIAREAQWPKTARVGRVMSWFAWVWPIFFAGSVVLAGMSLSYAFGSSGPAPAWLNVVGGLSIYGTFFGTLGLLTAMFVFWIVLAVRMRRIRREAKVIHDQRRGVIPS